MKSEMERAKEAANKFLTESFGVVALVGQLCRETKTRFEKLSETELWQLIELCRDLNTEVDQVTSISYLVLGKLAQDEAAKRNDKYEGKRDEAWAASKTVRVRIRRLVETDEYKVIVKVDDKINEAESYFTDDKQDAKDTRDAIMREYRKRGFRVTN